MKLSSFFLTLVCLSALSGCGRPPAPTASSATPEESTPPAIVSKLTDWMPGRPIEANERKDPTEITDFTTIYRQNCIGCHGNGATVGSSVPMNNPLYLTIIPKEEMRKLITSGVPGKPMSPFAIENGGPLTDKQIDILINGIYAWAKNPADANLPPYSAPIGNLAAGATTFAMYCASCHGADGNGILDSSGAVVKGKGGSVVNPAYLSLVSDQYLRTITMVGRPDLGCPDYQTRVPGKAMSNDEISDVVAWLVSHRQTEFGQPLPATQPN